MGTEALLKLCQRAVAYERPTKLQWYSRVIMWRIADRNNLPSVEAMSNEQYADALIEVNTFFRKQAPLRKAWAIEEYKGPQNIQDRGTELEDYTGGSVHLFKYYSYRRFCTELLRLRDHVTPDTATEREFMTALHRTAYGVKKKTVRWYTTVIT